MSKQKILSITSRTADSEEMQRLLNRVEREKKVTGNTRSRILMDMLLTFDEALGEKSFYNEMKTVFVPHVRNMLENNNFVKTPVNNYGNTFDDNENTYDSNGNNGNVFNNSFLRNGR